MPQENSTQTFTPEDRVDAESVSYKKMAPAWELTGALRGGTPAMRDAGTKYLPQESRERENFYKDRLARSFLFEAYNRAIDRVAAMPFSKEVVLDTNLPASSKLSAIEKDADGAGRTLTQFAKDVFDSGIDRGLCHILVDMTKSPQREDGRPLTLADERAANVRPFLVQIDAEDMLGWKIEPGTNGELSEIRFRQWITEPVGLYGDESIEHIRVYSKQGWELWRRDPDAHATDPDAFQKIDEGLLTLDKIPLATFYACRTGPMMAKPPLEALAQLNLEHWQSHSDQSNLLRFARAGLWFFSGLSKDDVEKQISIGPQAVFRTTSKDAQAKVVEHSGDAIEAGREHDKDLLAQMEAVGAQPLTEQRLDKTATGVAVDEARSSTDAKSWAQGLGLALTAAVVFASEWAVESLADDFKVEVFDDWDVASGTGNELDHLQTAAEKNMLPVGAYQREVIRRGLIKNVTAEELMQELKDEGGVGITDPPNENTPSPELQLTNG